MYIGLPSLGLNTLGPNFGPSSLFASGAPGAWYDPSDFSTLFQDSAGTTPVTATGQPVGLLLDKRLGAVRGPNIAPALSAANWVVTGADATHIVTFSNGTMRYQSDTTAPTLSVDLDPSLVAGAWYEVTVTTSAWTSGSLKTNAFNNNVVVSSGVGVVTTIGQALTTDFNLLRSTANVDLTISRVVVKQLSGNHATQATAINRPILQQDASGFYYLAFNGTNSWMSTASIDFTATNKVTAFAGLLKSSDAALGMALELSANSGTNAGTFDLQAPAGAASATYAFISKGVAGITAITAASYAAPISDVLTGIGDISGNVSKIRVNGADAATNNTSQGGGTFGSYPFYMGARGGASLFFNGRLYSLIVVGAAQSAGDITLAERWIGSKMGIAL